MKRESMIIILLLILISSGFFNKNCKEPIDNQPMNGKMEGKWKRFGDLNFNDKVWITNQEEN
tara:strand:+ start:195 stop:380 length:186 start_codon:yes stop_codon:yes gene_type:complete